MSRVISVTTALAGALLAAAPGAVAQATPSQDGNAVDTAYIRQVIRSNFLEVGLGRVAESHGESSSVKEFAKRMVSDHNSMNQQWTSLARKNRMAFTVDFGPNGKQTIDRLEDLSGADNTLAQELELLRRLINEQA